MVGSPKPASRSSDDVVDEVLTATRALIGLSTRSLGALAEDLSAAQYRALVVLAARGPQRIADLADHLQVSPSSAGRMCDRLVRKGFVRRHRSRTDRRIVMVSLDREGRRALDEATAARRVMISDALSTLSVEQQRAAAAGLRALSRALGEIPDHDWPATPS
ncbi:DNA-binding MarR family transcriptional regulator [Antricoccus suffuscus]|uniref:DNA-binding MarR family transcriptional regulator n=1 Tax=Antricoccus suffuscus TaxID=1629062 RepID=A0A2T1A6V7_9ACTN|nr:MarR family transcriptional regulator [Antricoccus suffuscus]PRZ44345.1 DNA-binding MarR family transcriptional regulator [Antricoccus suffuscus]